MTAQSNLQSSTRTDAQVSDASAIKLSLQILCLLYAAFVLISDAQNAVWQFPTSPWGGTLGVATQRSGGGFVEVTSVEAGGAMADAGVTPGDRLKFDRRYDYRRRLQAGESVTFTRNHLGLTTRQTATAHSRVRPWTANLVVLQAYNIASVLTALLGTFILWRSGGKSAPLLLGLAVVAYGMTNAVPSPPFSSPDLLPVMLWLSFAGLMALPVFFYGFARRFSRDQLGPPRPVERVLFWSYVAVNGVAGCTTFLLSFEAITVPIIADGEWLAIILQDAGLALALAYLIWGWRKAPPESRRRYVLMMVGITALMVAQALDLIPNRNSPAAQISYLLANCTLGLGGSCLLAYAILRYRVLDLGFAVNRTLVFAVVSALLLAIFGVVEWAADHLVPIAGREKNVLIDAAVAVGVFLTFHRVRDSVEHAIETLFFRRWQQAEAELRRFVREAAFITETRALSEAFVHALGRFGEGARAAVYLDDGGGYDRVVGEVGGLAAHLDANLPALVTQRADLKPVDLHDGPFSGLLMAPIVVRNAMNGLAVLGPKPSGQSWRPDEIELVGWATRQVGLDLHALTIQQLEKERSELRVANAQLERLMSLTPSRA